MYYLIEITDTNSGVAKAITSKSDITTAIMSLHQVLASAMANANVSSCACLVLDAKGTVQRYEYWERENDAV